MSDSIANPIFGRKVFFLSPSYSVNNNIIPKLQKLEYEIYKIPMYRQAKGTLMLNPDSICIITLDNQISMREWHNFIKSFQDNEILRSIQLGIINERIKSSTIELFKSTTTLGAGFIKYDNNNEVFVNNIVEALDTLNAKGRRKYVRVSCVQEKDTEVFWYARNMMIKAKIVDISSVGAAIMVPQKFASFLKPNDVLKDLTIMIGSKQMTVNATILTVKPAGENVVGVFLLNPDTPDSTRDFIRNYVSDNLQRAMTLLTAKQPSDTQDYNFTDEDTPAEEKLE